MDIELSKEFIYSQKNFFNLDDKSVIKNKKHKIDYINISL